jgi:hypothetical protein
MHIAQSFAVAQQPAPGAEAGAILIASVVVVLIAFVLGVGLIVRLVLNSGGDDDDPGSDGGGPGRRRPAPGRPPSAPPDWWPEFEREFADYVVAANSRKRGIETGGR